MRFLWRASCERAGAGMQAVAAAVEACEERAGQRRKGCAGYAGLQAGLASSSTGAGSQDWQDHHCQHRDEGACGEAGCVHPGWGLCCTHGRLGSCSSGEWGDDEGEGRGEDDERREEKRKNEMHVSSSFVSVHGVRVGERVTCRATARHKKGKEKESTWGTSCCIRSLIA